MKLSLLALALPLSVAVATPCMYPSSDACGDGQYCSIEAGKCALRIASQPGTCAPQGAMACPMNFAPVCGCDMNTYANFCLAGAAGVNVIFDGPCDENETSVDPMVAQECTFPAGEECGDGQYCSIEAGKCALRIASQPGTCAPQGAMACPMNIAYVCGCDMNTYANFCLAAAAGVNVMTDGPCDDNETPVDPMVAQECTFPAGEECGDDQYCAVEAGKCALRSIQPGTCAPQGNMACPFNIAPVCGCDMNTYDNNCLAGAAGVNVMAVGPCDAPVGGDYCTWSPDETCYIDGWPQCCLNDDQPCPPNRQPRCDNNSMPGSSYCTYSPDTECYESGWPACCGRFDGTNCPTDQPSCDAPGMEATFPLGSKIVE